MAYINLNGKTISTEDAGLPADNGAFRYGYGLFETMLVQDGAIKLVGYHMERLYAGLKQLYFELPALITPAYLEQQVLLTVKKNKLEECCRVRLQVYAGGGGLYGGANKHPGFVIECFPLEEGALELNENGLVVGIADGLAKSADSLSNLKSCNALIYAIAAKQAKEQRWNDALICNTAGNIIESTIANIFVVKEGTLYTPPLAEGCVAGIMRRAITERVAVVQKKITPQDIHDADEVFLTNAIKQVRWVREIADKQYSNEHTRRIYADMRKA